MSELEKHAPNGAGKPVCGTRRKNAKIDATGAHDCPKCISTLAAINAEADGFSLRPFEIRDQKRLDDTETDFTAPEPVVALCRFVLRVAPELAEREDVKILDPSAGAGIFGQVLGRLVPHAHLTGVELRGEEERHLHVNYTVAVVADFEVWAAEQIAARQRYEEECAAAGVEPDPRAFRFDAVVTNPPFSRAFRRDYDKETGAITRRAWIEICHDLLVPGGLLVFVGLTQWGQTLESSDLLRAYPAVRKYRFGGRLSFEEHGRTDSREYSGWIWRNEYQDPVEVRAERDYEPSWTETNGRPLAVRKWKAGAIPGTYPLPPELFS